MRIGYSFWGFLGDIKLDEHGHNISSPDGNSTYCWSIIWELQRRGHTVYAMQKDRDTPAWKRYGSRIFASFSSDKREQAYLDMIKGKKYPKLDVLLLEWRFIIPGRNDQFNPTNMKFNGPCEPDLHRQLELLRYYSEKDTKIIIWDLDHKLTKEDEFMWTPHKIFETSVIPRKLYKERTRVEIPFHIPDLNQFQTLPQNTKYKLVYIGSRYERDDIITEWIKPVSDVFPEEVIFYGNWSKTLEDCKKKWPNISYNDRCTVLDFRHIYSEACACPLLAKKSYFETGFITARLWESLLFGTIPIGLKAFRGINRYCTVVADVNNIIDVVHNLSNFDLIKRDKLRKENIEKIEFMDVSYFVNEMLT